MNRRRAAGLSFSRKKRRNNMKIVKEVFIWIFEIAMAVLLAFTFVYFVGLRTSAVGQSMAETIFNGDNVLVNRFVYAVSDPKPNDIVVFRPNGNEKSHLYIKRVIAGPGDEVQIIKGVVYVNGEVFSEAVSVSSIEEAGIAAEPITLKEDEYFVLGDNRNNSEDSRFANIGNVRKEHIIGQVWFRIVSWKEFGFL